MVSYVLVFCLDSAPKCYGLRKGFVTSMSKDDQQISSLAAQLDQRGCDDIAGCHFDEEQARLLLSCPVPVTEA